MATPSSGPSTIGVRPLVRLGAIAAWLGAWRELARPRRGALRALFGTPAVHVLLAGIDRREGFPVGRADALVVLRAEPVGGRVALLLPPRDLLVTGADEQPVRLNEAYFLGAIAGGGDDPRAGLRRLRSTAAEALGIPVPVAAAVDLGGFVDLVDALGGVTVDVEHEIDDDFVGEDGQRFVARFPAGPQALDGEAALIYARTRMADGDRWRRARHAELVRALVAAGLRALRSPHRWPSVVATARRTLVAEPGLARLLVAGATLARGRHRLESVPITPPAVQSVRLATGWYHLADPEGLARVVADRFVGGRPPTVR